MKIGIAVSKCTYMQIVLGCLRVSHGTLVTRSLCPYLSNSLLSTKKKATFVISIYYYRFYRCRGDYKRLK
jgi:hypothetical protein